MYENEIEDLKTIRSYTPRFAEALNTAIALMRERAAARAESAAEIERLQAELDMFRKFSDEQCLDLRAEIERLRKSYDVQIDHMRRATAEIAHLRAELAALKAAGKAEDEAAEREHCASVADEIDNGPNVSAAHYIERERAAVRGPLVARIRELEQALQDILESTDDQCAYQAAKEALEEK